jgi:hypothetical protein
MKVTGLMLFKLIQGGIGDMVDIVGLGMLVIGGYVLVKYGPQIAANIQAGQNPLTGVVPQVQAAPPPATPVGSGGGGLPAAAIPAVAQLQALSNVNPCAAFPNNPLYDARTNQCHPDSQILTPPATIAPPPPSNPRNAAAPTPPAGFRPRIAANTPPPTPSGCVPPCTPQTCPDICPPAAPNTRAPKKKTPTHAAAAAKPVPIPAPTSPDVTGPPVGVAGPPRCLCPTTGNKFFQDGFPGANCPTKGEICTASSNVGYYDGYNIPVMGPQWYETVSNKTYSANMTQVINGKSVTSIDPFFPAGWYVAEANRRSSLHEPGLH